MEKSLLMHKMFIISPANHGQSITKSVKNCDVAFVGILHFYHNKPVFGGES